MIQMSNWFLTRQCNLKCHYCRISKAYNNPVEYKDFNHFIKNEMSLVYIKHALQRLKQHNPEMFHCFLGGEPLIRKDMADIINYCNRLDLMYTITTNSTLYNHIYKLLDDVSYLFGLSFSVDPDIMASNSGSLKHMVRDDDADKKSSLGLSILKELSGHPKIQDLTADVVVTELNKEWLIPLLKALTELNVTSNINIVSPGVNEYYDFSDVADNSLLLKKNKRTKEIFEEIKSSSYKYLMGPEYIDVIYNHLPNKVDCKLEKGIHNISIDADGSVRLCSMIRGVDTPKLNVLDYVNADGTLDDRYLTNVTNDKRKYCSECSLVCIQMSKVVEDGLIDNSKLANK